ncbi:MAG TPA: hypothetical protein VF676_02025 [Flavobacterium sp.]|jgi:hypothetical protein
MKKICLLILLISFTGYSQQLKYGSNGKVLNANDEKISPTAVRELLAVNPAALKLYNSGRSKKTWGNILFYGGIGLGVGNLVDATFNPKDDFSASGEYRSHHEYFRVAILGGVLIAASIPIKLGYSKKVKAAVDGYNANVVYQEMPNVNVSLVANGQGLGVAFRF